MLFVQATPLDQMWVKIAIFVNYELVITFFASNWDGLLVLIVATAPRVWTNPLYRFGAPRSTPIPVQQENPVAVRTSNSARILGFEECF
jgi:hypothetical protein